jgi:hypothetical protein
LDTLFGEASTGIKLLVVFIAALVVLALAFWLVRRFSGGRLGGGSARGRQPRLAVIDQAAVDGRRRLVLIRRDNVEHLLIIGGPTDVVVEQNILRATAVQREATPVRPAAASDTLPRAVPLGDDGAWPLQPEPATKPEPAAPKAEPTTKLEPAPRFEPSLRMDDATRPPKAATTSEEAAPWPGEPEAPAVPPPLPTAAPASIAAAARERRARALDPLAGLAEELSRVPGPPEPGPRRAPRLPPTGPTPPTTPPAPPVVPTSADASLTPPADQNLSEMAQRLEAALRRPAKPADKPADKPGEKAADARQGASPAAGAPASGERDEFAPPPRPARFESPLRRPLKADDQRASPPSTPKAAGEPAAPETEDGAPRPDAIRPGAPEAKQSKSLYDSLEQEMASLLNRPPTKP